MKLGDLINIQSGFAFDSKLFSEDEGMPLIRIRDIVRGFSETFYNGEYRDDFIVKEGDILIGMDGEFKISKWKGVNSLLNQRVCRIFTKNPKITNETYLLYILAKELKEIEDKTSFVTVKHLSVKKIEEIEITLPPLSTQQRIAEILDKADALRRKDQALLKKYDDLAQAIFMDMFGDPVKNEMGWDVKTIEEIVVKDKHAIKRGPFGGALKKEIFVESGYLVYEQYHALNNDFSFARYYIDEEKYKELKAFEVKPKDIIISCSGIYLGKLAVIPKEAKRGIINQALLKVTLDENIYLNEFFIKIFTQENFKEKYFASERGAAIPNFPPMSAFKEFKFICPPLKIQKIYLSKVENLKEQVELLKSKKSENLFQSLLQQAFKGELV